MDLKPTTLLFMNLYRNLNLLPVFDLFKTPRTVFFESNGTSLIIIFIRVISEKITTESPFTSGDIFPLQSSPVL